MSSEPKVSIVIHTRNRRDELHRSLGSSSRQAGVHEILLVDDHSDDDTLEFVEREYPHVKLISNTDRGGIVVRRNQGARAAEGDIIVSIDDDAEFTSDTSVAEAVEQMQHPRVAAIGLPVHNWVGDEKRPLMLPMPPDDRLWCSGNYIGCGYAMWRGLFLQLGGYTEELYFYSEEEDYCRRIWSNGYVVRAGKTAPVHHFPSQSGRSETTRMHTRERNRYLLSTWYAPWWALPVEFAGNFARSAREFVRGANWARRKSTALSTVGGFVDSCKLLRLRRPSSSAGYLAFCKVRRNKILPLEELEDSLPEPTFGPASEVKA